MNKILTQEQLNQIVVILNEMPIKEFNRVQAIIEVLNTAETLKEENNDEPDTED